VIAHYRLGIIYNSMKKYKLAIESFKKVLECSKNHASALYHLGYAYWGMRERAEAIKAFKKAIDINPRDKRAWDMLDLLINVPEP
ncbi:tetratricopeptide repeat protein, partial [candidate division WOR-3 bacterium]|nr:tetratricopeptide repeat protein [candidate division WOR-3 bacterium]